ncbi:hypothetical protein ACQ4WX_49490 [Streptomyces lasalocidi]
MPATLLAVHHLSYYEAVDRLPLGAATTMEFLGPFAIALFGSRRATDLLWACLAMPAVSCCSATPAFRSMPRDSPSALSPGAAGAATSSSPNAWLNASPTVADWPSPSSGDLY